MTANRRTFVKLGLAASLSSLGVARAQSMPETARIIVGFPPGGAPDTVARRLADQLAGKLAKSVVVDNRPGAAGRIAVDIARQSPPDGSTLLLTPSGVLTINPFTYKQLNYDPFKDFTAVSLASRQDYGFAVGPAVPAEVKTIAEFAQWAKAHPAKANFGTPAAGSPPHFVGASLARSLGVDLKHVPYRGGTPALTDVMGGQIAAAILSLGDMVVHEKAGKLRILAATGRGRSKYAPEVATFAEQAVPGLEFRDWMAVFIVGAASPEVQARTGALVRAAAGSPAYAQALSVVGLDAAASAPQELERLIRADYDLWGPIVKATGFVADV